MIFKCFQDLNDNRPFAGKPEVWDAAFRAGMERAAEIVETTLDDSEWAWPSEGMPAQICHLPQAIRAEMGRNHDI